MENELPLQNTIESRILTLRGVQVMLDRDLAELYGVETRRLNEQVKRNKERFPEDFMFQITNEEISVLRLQALENSSRSQIATLNTGRGSNIKYNPYVFTEQGVAMLSSVLRSSTAVEVNIRIMRAFVSMRHFLQNNAQVFAEIKSIRQHQIQTDIQLPETNSRIDELFDRMDRYKIDDTQGIFFQGQIFDAYAKFEQILAT